jgi:NADPH:quinone reductase-like Zn-dependent oxidoreductase
MQASRATLFYCWLWIVTDIMAKTSTALAPGSSSSTITAPRAWTIPKGVSFGDLSRLVLQPSSQEEDPIPINMVKVATRAVGLNFADVFTVLGYYKAANLVRTEEKNAFVPGLEFSGIVLEDYKNEFMRGDRVYGFTRFGAYSDVVKVPPTSLRKLPSNWSFEEGAAFLVNALTAWHGLVTVAGMPTVDKKERAFVVVVHSAAGGVGLWASEIAARRGALVVGVVGQESKIEVFQERIRSHCPEAQCIVRSNSASKYTKDLQAAIVTARCIAARQQAPRFESSQDLTEQEWGADIVMECYGGLYFQSSLDLLNPGGSLATYGSTTYNGSGVGNRLAFLPLVWKYLQRPRIDPGELTGRNIRVGGFNLIFLTERKAELSKALEDCIACLGGGNDRSVDALKCATPPIVGRVFDFDKGADEALRALRSGMTVGKVVLTNEKNPMLLGFD